MDADIAYFEWKYLANPAGSFIGFVALHNHTNEVAAYYGVIPQLLVIEGIPQLIFQSCDTMTHSRHRRKGLFKLLALRCYDELRSMDQLFVIGFGGADSTPGFLKFGWKQVAFFRYFLRPAISCRISSLGPLPINDFTENPTDTFLQACLDGAMFPAAIHSPRSVAHIRWRTSNPGFQYNITGYTKNGSPAGFAIWYTSDRKLILFDIIYLSESARRALIKYLCKVVSLQKLRGIIGYAENGGRHARLLRKSGFISNPFRKGPLTEKTPVIFYSTEERMQKFLHASDWELTDYDHDAL